MDLLSYLQVAAVTGGTILLLSVYFYCRNKHNYWKRKGVDGPKPIPVVGTILENYFGHRMQVSLDRAKKYGKIYGAYQGLTPFLIIADPKVIHQISIKDFDVFPNHAFVDPVLSNKISRSFLISLKDEHWKKVRAFLSPTFTSGKIRRMFKLLDGCANDLISCAREQLSASKDSDRAIINAKDLYNLYAMDAIATCCYGLKLERAGSKDLKTAASRNEFVHLAMKQFEFSMMRMIIALSVPKPVLKLFGFTTSPMSKVQPFADKVRVLLEKRRNTAKKFDDYLQLLVDAKLDAEMELDEMDLAENHHAGLTHESLIADQEKMLKDLKDHKGTKPTLSDVEILSNAMFLLVVGLETTGTLLTHCTCILAFHQTIQERLHQEIVALAEYNEDKTKLSFSYDALTSCKYLDAVISETLRIYPPVMMIDRISVSPYKIDEYNIDLPEESRLFFDFYAVQNDPDLWEEPEKFNPDRFMPGNREKIVPGSYCPFGIGPRHCIGMRFSLTETKLALAKLITNFRFEPTPNATWPLKPKRTLAINNIADPAVVMIARQTEK